MDDRTVVNELQHGSTQSSLACKTCRKKKLKCDRTIPQCRHCQKASRTCEYPPTAQKPGPRPGTHRRTGLKDRRDQRSKQPNNSPGHQSNGTLAHSESGPGSTPSGTNASAIHINDQFAISTDPVHQFGALVNDRASFRSACQSMQLSEENCLKLIEIYFGNMTSFSLFHHPTFFTKVASIQSAKEVQALLTTMFAYSSRFTEPSEPLLDQSLYPDGIIERAHQLTSECLRECGDGLPSLHLLQAFILQSHMFSATGVRGRTWRLTGQCIRIAYELRLHELDADPRDRSISSEAALENWIEIEEKRRAWWGVWECDVFTSTILRLPNGIDWTRNRTNLPSCDEDWYYGRPARSCHLHIDPTRRWRNLRDSGNTSPIAWFIMLNSYKWDSLSASQRISPPTTYFEREDYLKGHFDLRDYKSIFIRKREMLENCLRCALGALPSSLQLSGYLSFDPSPAPYPGLNRVRQHFIYMSHIMGQVTQLLISRKDLEAGNLIAYPADFTQPTDQTDQPQSHTEQKRWQRCLLVADKMASTVRAASPEHFRHCNPNAATALWMAAATQLIVLAYHRDDIDVELAQSNLDLLTTTIESFIAFWDVPRTLLQSLATLEHQLKLLGGRHHHPDTDTAATPAAAGAFHARHTANDANSSSVDGAGGMFDQTAPFADMPSGMAVGEDGQDLSPFDVLQAMDFGAMYNGVDNWESLFLDPGFVPTNFEF